MVKECRVKAPRPEVGVKDRRIKSKRKRKLSESDIENSKERPRMQIR
jgi:hypothetical protein